MTVLAYIFTMEKALVKIIFGRKCFILHPFFIFFCGTSYDFWDAKDLLGHI